MLHLEMKFLVLLSVKRPERFAATMKIFCRPIQKMLLKFNQKLKSEKLCIVDILSRMQVAKNSYYQIKDKIKSHHLNFLISCSIIKFTIKVAQESWTPLRNHAKRYFLVVI